MTVLEGPVEAANERGIRVQGEWANVSTYRKIELPDVGTPVRLEVDAKGWIKTLLVCNSENGHLPEIATRPVGNVQNGHVTEMNIAPDRTAVRLAVLQAAASFLGSLGQAREAVKADHVLRVAESWLAWVEQA